MVQLSDKERQVRGLDALGAALRPLVDSRMTSAAHGRPWVPLYEAKESARLARPHRVNPDDPRELLRIIRFERGVFTDIDGTQRAWTDELIQAGNRAAHSLSVAAAEADRALDTMSLLAASLGLEDAADKITALRAWSTTADHAQAASRAVPSDAPPVNPVSAPLAPETLTSTPVPLGAQPPPGQRALTRRVLGLDVVVLHDEAVSYAMVHNSVSPLRSIHVEHHGTDVLDDVRLELVVDSPLSDHAVSAPLVVELGRVAPDDVVDVPVSRLAWRMAVAPFLAFTEAVSTTIHLHVHIRTDEPTRPAEPAEHRSRVASDVGAVRLLTADEWWATSYPEVLAAFVRPNDPAVIDLLSAASELLLQRTGSSALDGYQAGPERVHEIATAVYDALAARQVRYIEPPPSFESTGQRIRTHSFVLEQRWGTCLDLACTYAAALEHAGINPVLVVLDSHAFAGYLTDEMELPAVAVTQLPAITTIVDSDLFDAVETVCTTDAATTFDTARAAVRHWWTTDLGQLRYLLDVRAAHRRTRPLPTQHLADGTTVVETVQEAVAVPPRRLPHATPRAPQAPAEPARITKWRRSLLDMTYANPLLKLKPASSVPIHVPTGSLKLLGTIDQRLTIYPHDQIADIHRAAGARTAGDVAPEVTRRIMDEERTIFAALPQTSYQRSLRNLSRRARTSFEETGANNLYLALGTLEWTERGKAGRAPLYLIPVRLTDGRGTRPFGLELDDTRDTQPNYCLVEKLNASWGLDLSAVLTDPPELVSPDKAEHGIDIDGALAQIRTELVRAKLVDFQVAETAHLALFQFSTLEMWRDLTENWRTFMSRPTVRHLIETPGRPFSDGVDPPDDDPTAEATTYLPVPADGSQIDAVRWAASGKSFILEGPPGTGKSQTITNLIAHLLAEGKKVLFVAEKQAALDVVKRRLDEVGLGPFCLDLHGRTQTVTETRRQLTAALDVSAPTTNVEVARATYRTLVESLSAYPRQLHEPGPAGLSAWEAREILLELNEHAGPDESLPVPRAVAMGSVPIEAVYSAAHDLGAALIQLGTLPDRSPWRLAGPLDPDRLDRHAVADALGALQAADAAVTDPTARQLTFEAGTQDQLEAVAQWLDFAHAGIGRATSEARALATPAWRAQAAQVREAIARFRAANTVHLGPFAPTALTLDLDALADRAHAADKKPFGKKKARQAIVAELAQALPQGPDSVPPAQLTVLLDRLLWLRNETRQLASFAATSLPGVAAPFGWNPLDDVQASAYDRGIAAVEVANHLAATLPATDTDTLTAHILQAGTAVTGPMVRQLAATWGRLVVVLGATETDVRFWLADRTRGEAMAAHALEWSSDAAGLTFIMLQRWVRVRSALQRLIDLGIPAADALVRTGALRGPGVEDAVRTGVAREILAERLDSTGLVAFDGVERKHLTDRFLAIGADIRHQLVTELPARIVRARTFDARQQRVGKVAELQGQLGRRRGGLTIRQLMHRYGDLISQITPCVLTSPSSVARFLPDDADFDCVVFDEASQIRVPQAIGAMGRGRSVVIVGDSQQMPPSSMFVASSAGDDDETTTDDSLPVLADMDSILSEGVESGLPRLMLSWHYRSLDESLITFSNHTYYDDRLSSFPAPPGRRGTTALSLRAVDGTWEGGGRAAARVNRAEAQAVLEQIRTLLARDPELSIGVVTFNIQQRDLLLDMLDQETDPAIDAARSRDDEPLFVKNLENVQGDERDVIIFTLAFARGPDGKIPTNWGPLNRAGGEKRLNVAITRAKMQMVIFASFDPHELDLGASTSRGLKHLKDYLLAVKNGMEDSPLNRPPERDRHLDEIATALGGAGLEVRPRVGLSGFTVDLAARRPGGPWVAILLDGPEWAGRTTVGDRDGLPRTVLTGPRGRGWSAVEHVWLPTWVRNPTDVVDAIVEVANQATHTPEPEPGPAPGLGSDVLTARDPSPATSAASGQQPEATVAPTRADHGVQAGATGMLRAKTLQTAEHPTAPPDQPPDGVERFRAANGHVVASSYVLDCTSQQDRAAVTDQIARIVQDEGPILVDRLLKVLAMRYGVSRLRETRRARLADLVPQSIVEVTHGDVIAWPPGTDRTRFFGYRIPGDKREITDIPYPELINAMVTVVRRAVSMSEEDVLRETAREFGVTRLASRVRPRLEQVLDGGLQEGRLVRQDGLVGTP